MTLYYFNLHECGVVFPDEERREVADAENARDLAVRHARSIMASEIVGGHLCLSNHIEIVDAGTGERTEVPFRDAVELTGL